MSQFYKIDSTRVTLREYWWGTKSPIILIGLILKWMRIRIPSSTDDPNAESTLPFLVDTLPAETMAEFQPLAAELNSLGFLDPVYHVIHEPGTQTTLYWATFRHITGNSSARIHQRAVHLANKTKRILFPMFFTEFTDGTFLASSAGKPDMLAPASVEMIRQPRAACSALWTTHQLEEQQASGTKSVLPVNSREELIRSIERQHILVRDFHLARGVFRARTEAEQQSAQAFNTSVLQAQTSGISHPEVYAELEKLQNQKTSWTAGLWILAGSVILFIAAGAAQWDWKFTLWLIPVLFIHEAGHWLTMRAFNYRNLRMFFIPFFGAAVTGQNWNVPGWKKALVSLAGPLPGILLGSMVTVAALILHKPWMIEAAIIFLVINGFNLLPVLPLDGGHVLRAVLFCRNRWLDIGFRILAILALLALSHFSSGRFFLYLAIAMGISLPVTFKIGKVIDELRNAPLPPPLPNESRIPLTTAETIITAVKAALPKGTNNKTLAIQSLNVFETLNARPPGALATIGLLAAHAGGVVLLILFGALLLVGKHGGLGDFFNAAAHQPAQTIQCASVKAWNGPARPATFAPENLLIITLKNQNAAATAFSDLTPRLPSDASLTLFGGSLLLTLPANDDDAREKWFDQLQTLSTNLFVTVSNRSATASIQFIAPDAIAATNLTRQLKDYFNVAPGVHLIAPWSPAAGKPEFENHLKARQQWKYIRDELSGVWRDPSVKALDGKFSAAVKRGAKGEVNRLTEEREKLMKGLEAATIARLRTNSANQIDAELLELHQTLTEISFTNRTERAAIMRKVGEKLGAVPYEEGHPAKNADDLGAGFGMVTQHGLMVQLAWVSFFDAPEGMPAFTQWLCNQNCAGIRYEFLGAYGGSFDETEEDLADLQ